MPMPKPKQKVEVESAASSCADPAQDLLPELPQSDSLSCKRSYSIGIGITDEIGEPEDGAATGSRFNEALTKLLGELQSCLLEEHEMDFRSLQAENNHLRERLRTAGQTTQAQDNDLQEGLRTAGQTAETRSVADEDADEDPLLTDSTSQSPYHHISTNKFVKREVVSPKYGVEQTPNTIDRQVTKGSLAGVLFDDQKRSLKSIHLVQSYTKMPEGQSCIERIVFSTYFDLGCAIVILANCILIALEQQYRGIDNGKAIGAGKFQKTADQTWPGAEEVFLGFDFAFNTCFCLELVFRLLALKTKAISSAWIWFDTIIVALGVVDISATVSGNGVGMGMNPTMVRVARLVRVVRLFKAFRATHQFDSLFLLIKAIGASWVALTWSFLILGVVQVVVGLFLCQVLQAYIENEDHDLTKRRDVFMYFGTFTRTMITMFEITLANWAPSCRLLMDNVSELFILFYIVYRCMFCFAVIRVIAAVFITETNRVLESDDELNVMKSARAKRQGALKLRRLFESIDLNHDGAFDFDELQQVMKYARTAQWLSTLQIDINDFEKVFWLLDDGTGRIRLDDFVGKVQQLRGQAKTVDVSVLLQLCHRIDTRLKNGHRAG